MTTERGSAGGDTPGRRLVADGGNEDAEVPDTGTDDDADTGIGGRRDAGADDGEPDHGGAGDADEVEAGADDDRSRTRPAEIPEWDDAYLDRVADALMYSYDLARDVEVAGEPFAMYGRMVIHSQKQIFHPAVRYGRHESVDHLFVRRLDRPRPADLERLVELGETLADEWIETDESHFETAFTFVVVADEVPDGVAGFVDDHDERTLLRWGFDGHYEIRLVVVAPDREDSVATPSADVAAAFALWDEGETEERGGLLSRLFG